MYLSPVLWLNTVTASHFINLKFCFKKTLKVYHITACFFFKNMFWVLKTCYSLFISLVQQLPVFFFLMVLHVIIVYSSDILMKFNMSQRVNKSVITSVSSLIIFSFITIPQFICGCDGVSISQWSLVDCYCIFCGY